MIHLIVNFFLSSLHSLFTGRAVFTSRQFKKEEFLLHYDGELITAEEGEKREEVEETGFRFFFQYKQRGWW